MIQVILLILKIIGITLLILLGLVLLLIALILFVPIRYRVRVIYKPEHKEAEGRVSFLFPMIFVKFHYLERFMYQGRLFGYVFLDSEKPKKEKESEPKKEKKAKKKKIGKEQKGKPQNPPVQRNVSVEEHKKAVKQETPKPEEIPKMEENPGFFEKWRLKLQKISNTISTAIDKVRKLLHQKEAVGRILKKPENRQAVSFVWDKVKRLVRHILPRKIKGYLAYGSSDPAVTGQVLGIISVLYAKTGPAVRIVPNFEEEQLEFDLEFCGAVQIFTLLAVAVKLFMSEKLKQLIQEIKHLKEVE